MASHAWQTVASHVWLWSIIYGWPWLAIGHGESWSAMVGHDHGWPWLAMHGFWSYVPFALIDPLGLLLCM